MRGVQEPQSGAGASARQPIYPAIAWKTVEDRLRPMFHGAFCYAVLQGMQIVESLEFSNAMAAWNGAAPGARGGICGLQEVRAPMARAARRSHPSFATHE